jgi:polyisoprenoid-binding protein YceI
MIMKKIGLVSALILGVIAVVGFVSSNKAELTEANVDEASILWTGSKITGGSHSGTLEIKDSHLDFVDGKLSGGKVEIDMGSLKNTDLEGEGKQKLEDHLTSDDFFATDKHPISSLTITSVRPGQLPETFEVTGDLTIKETTRSEDFTVIMKHSETETVFKASLKIDRTLYGVKYGSTNFFEGLGDKAIKNHFDLDVKITVSNELE